MREKALSGTILTLLSISVLTLAFNAQLAKATPVTITVIGPWSGAEWEAFKPVLDAFTAKTGIGYEYKIYRAEDLLPVLESQFPLGEAPGDVIFMWPWYIAEAGAVGHIIEVTDLINEAEFTPGAHDPVKVGVQIYGGAYTGKGKPGFWYRKSFFAANGLTEPTTWAEFTTLLSDIAAIPGIIDPIVSGDEVGWPLSDVTEHFVATFGGVQLQKDLIDGKIKWTSPEVRAIFEEKLVPTLGYFSDPISWIPAIDLWWGGEYGLYFMGSWITGMVPDPEDLGLFALPGAEGLVFVIDYAFIPTYTDHPDEAKELFKFLTSAEGQTIQVEQGGHIATNLGVPLDAYPAVDREIAEVMMGVEPLLDIDDTIGGEFQTTFWAQLQLLWVSPGSLDAVLKEIQSVAALWGDLDKNGEVDMRDVGTAALAFGSFPGHERWNPIADINRDYKVDIRDIATVAKEFGATREDP